MPGHSPLPRPPKPAAPAWAISIAIHAAMLVALVVAMNQQHGSPNAKYGSMGIVLHHSSDIGPISNGFEPTIKQTAAFMDMPPPPLLLASATVETNEPAATPPETPPPKSTGTSSAT